MLQTPPAPPELPPPAMTPERGAFIVRSVSTVASILVDSMLADLMERAPSTDSAPDMTRSERMLYRALRPFLPKLRALFLDKLSLSNPAALERVMGATSTAIESILEQAPGDPLPRWAWQWLPGEPRPVLVPLADDALVTVDVDATPPALAIEAL